MAQDAARAAAIRADLEAFVEAWERLPLFATQAGVGADALAEQRAVRRGHDPEGLARSLEVLGLGAQPDLWGAARVPVRWWVGERDAKFREVLAGVGAECVPGCGHNPVLEDPQGLARLLWRGW